jgi:cytoskeletal protein CcmA (bactofilin family)
MLCVRLRLARVRRSYCRGFYAHKESFVFTRKPNGPQEISGVASTAAPRINGSAAQTVATAPPPSPAVPARTASVADDGGVVVIGKGTKISGQIYDCAKLEIEGMVEGNIVADALVIREGGVVKGDVKAAHAEVHGVFQGKLTVEDLLDVRATGQVEGELSYGKLAVAMGGYMSGTINSESDTAAAKVTALAAVPQFAVPPVPQAAMNGRDTWIGQTQ